MAKLIPSLEDIHKLKIKPEEGELYILNFLSNNLNSDYEVYFNPFMNGDRPDIVILKKGSGVIIIEVKDYSLGSYKLNAKKQWELKNQNIIIKSPIDQVLKYKENLFNLHIENLLEKKIKDIRHFNTVSCVLYFHNATSNEITGFLIDPYKHDEKYLSFLNYNIDLLGRDDLNQLDLNQLLKRRYMFGNRTSILFSDDIYQSIKRFVKPPIHLIEQGREISYSPKQIDIIYERSKKQQRIKGVVGSGKTTILAARAVQIIKRTKGKVLILTFNITLKNYIKDKISAVREEFPWDSFIILNYHLFINIELNNLGIDFKIPEGFDALTIEEKDSFLETRYYSNKKLFADHKDKIIPYDAILVDEIQDYKRPWMDILKENFLAENGEYLLFGDVKQNIYNNAIIGKDVSTNVLGVTELKNSFRSDFKIKDLAIQYQKEIFKDKYEIDSFNSSNNVLEIAFERKRIGNVNYVFIEHEESVSTLYKLIYQEAISRDVPPNDITVLGNSVTLLKKFDAYFRYSSNEKTNTMFESHEMVYRMGLNYLKSDKPEWLLEGVNLIQRNNDKNEVKAFNQICILLTINDLNSEYEGTFATKFDFYCKKFCTTSLDFNQYFERYKSEIVAFKAQFGEKKQKKDIKAIRTNKKINFHMNTGTVKISTIHSFKGWETETLFLILEKKHSGMDMTFDEILYTGITRSRANLTLINFGNTEYHTRLSGLVEGVNK